ADRLRLREERAAARVPGALDDRRDAVLEGLVGNAPAGRCEDHERADEHVIDDRLRLPGTAQGVIRAFALAQSVVRGEEICERDLGRRRLLLDEQVAIRLLLG